MEASFYIGPGRPRLRTESWGDLIAATQAGVFVETQWVELKLAIPPTSSKANAELAKDLASLSVDGGVLVVGIKDAGSEASHVVGAADVENLKNRIDQVAGGRISPALQVQMMAVQNPADPGLSVLVVNVPASASAPHMVDEKYWGRSATGKRPLTDAEASRLWAERRGRRDEFEGKLTGLAATFDPIPAHERNFGRLYLLLSPAVPVNSRLPSSFAGKRVLDFVKQAADPNFEAPYNVACLEMLSRDVPHPDGLCSASADLSGNVEERRLTYLLLSDRGDLQLMSAAATDRYTSDGDGGVCIAPEAILLLTHQLLNLCGYVAANHLSYGGDWNIGVYMTGIYGLTSPFVLGYNLHQVSKVPFQSDAYIRVATVNGGDLSTRAPEIVEDLLGDFTRGLGIRHVFFPYVEPNEIWRRARY